jgi:protein SCO1
MKRLASLLCLMLIGAALADAPVDERESVYDLPIQLTDQQGRVQPLDLYRGHPVIVTMFYGSCPATCPLLIESLRATEAALPAAVRRDVRVLLVSIDAKRDTPTALAALAKQRRVDTTRWTLATAKPADIRLLAAALNVQYRRLPNGDYNHTSTLTLLSSGGESLKTTSVLGRADPGFAAAVTEAAKREDI